MSDRLKAARAIAQSMREHTHEWTLSEYTADHKSGLSVWIANIPVLSLQIWKPFTHTLGVVGQLIVYRAVYHLKSSVACAMLADSDELVATGTR